MLEEVNQIKSKLGQKYKNYEEHQARAQSLKSSLINPETDLEVKSELADVIFEIPMKEASLNQIFKYFDPDHYHFTEIKLKSIHINQLK